MRVLVVEDDRKAAGLLARGLREEGFVVDVVHSAEEGDVLTAGVDHELIILDWSLPGASGLDWCRALRERGVHTPVLMLTARDALSDRVAGLNVGADDYLTKPFAFEELLARVRAQLRRAELTRPAPLRAGDLTLDVQQGRALRAGVVLELTRKEFAIMETLVRHAGEIVTRSRLAEQVWQADLIAIDNLIDVHVGNLRRKLEPTGVPLIETVRGRGFRLALAPREHTGDA